MTTHYFSTYLEISKEKPTYSKRDIFSNVLVFRSTDANGVGFVSTKNIAEYKLSSRGNELLFFKYYFNVRNYNL